MEELDIIQGDTLNAVITIDNPDELEISQVTFECPSLNLSYGLTEVTDEDDTWALVISSEDTLDLWVGRWEFNVTAQTSGGQQFTIIDHGNFNVIYKRNRSSADTPSYVITGIGWTED